jgi:hypothetical protein
MTVFPHDWFWVVGGDESRAWSSAVGGYVIEYPIANGLTRIASEQELTDVLKSYGLPGPAQTQVDYASAIQFHVDSVAKARGYSDGVALASYVSSTVNSWTAEAVAFVAWRDAVWTYSHTELAKVLAGERAQPTVAEFLAELPAMNWPE